MKIIVDTNRVMAALIKEGAAREILRSSKFHFCTLDYVLEELNKHKRYVIAKSGMKAAEIDHLLSLIMENVWIVSDELVKTKIKEAIKTMENIDITDAPILACALAIKNDGIWTEDKHFDQQSKVKVWKTSHLMQFL